MENIDLIRAAQEVINPIKIGDDWVGDVGSALITDEGNVYTGVSVDFGSGLGCCAERNAIGTMITNKEYTIKKIVAVWNNNPEKDLFVLPPCGACRLYLSGISKNGTDVEVVLSESNTIKLEDLLPKSGWDVEKVEL